VHAEHDGTVAWAFVDVVDAKRSTVPIRYLGVPGLTGKIWEVAEAIVGRAQYSHGSAVTSDALKKPPQPCH
jgi:hypothetical protein